MASSKCFRLQYDFSVCFNGSKPLTNNTLIVNDLFILTNISEHCSFPCRKTFSYNLI